MTAFNTHSPPLFYGWLITAAAAVGLCFGYAGSVIYGFSSFILPLSAEFGWSRRDIGLAFSFMVVTVFLMSPLMGVLLDRYGARRCLLTGTLLFGLFLSSLYLLSPDIRHFYATFVLLGLSGTATTAICYSRLLVSWFEKRKGWALGLALTGTGVGAMIVPPLVQAIIQTAGSARRLPGAWRAQSYPGIAAAVQIRAQFAGGKKYLARRHPTGDRG